LGPDAIRAIYIAHVSAEDGRKVNVTDSAHAQSIKDDR
jgi:hypothetical protein